MRRLRKPKTRESDYQMRERRFHALMEQYKRGEISEETFRFVEDTIYDAFRKKIHERDTYLFATFSDFVRFVKKNRINGSLEHERKHARKLLELGYEVTYGIDFRFVKRINFQQYMFCYNAYVYGLDENGNHPKLSDIAKVAGVVEKPSIEDEHLMECFS